MLNENGQFSKIFFFNFYLVGFSYHQFNQKRLLFDIIHPTVNFPFANSIY